MDNHLVNLEGIAHEGIFDLRLEDWQHAMKLARCYGWNPSDERLWIHFFRPTGGVEPLPAAEARAMADALEGALAPAGTHGQFRKTSEAPAASMEWSATPEGKQRIKEIIAFLRKGGCCISFDGC
jgi:hypothetical protein